jgi:hypothetical protein
MLAQTTTERLALVNRFKCTRNLRVFPLRLFILTSKFLLNNLNQSQLSELSKGGKKPSWLPAVEKSAAEACLAPMPKLQV